MSPNDSWSSNISQLQPGDTLILQDGIYSPVTIDCTANATNGTASAPITLRAEHERRAHISSGGTTYAMRIHGCSYWVFHGLQVSSADSGD